MSTNTSAKAVPFTVAESLIGEGIINYKPTNNMNTNNNASQTLFRFVSLRNPQLTETKADNLGFIHRPKDLESVFDSQVSENDSAIAKFQSMERAAKSFIPTGFEKEAQIETGAFSELLKIGRKIAKKETLSDQDRDTAMDEHSKAISATYQTLWDNLMFQTVMQSDFYVKEAIIHILKALHYGYVCKLPVTEELTKINGTDLIAKALEAKVVLPLRFFGDGTDNSGSTITSRAFTVGRSAVGLEDPINAHQLPVAVQEQLKAEGEKISELSAADLEKQGLEKLKAELEKVQKWYYKMKDKAYDAAYKEYQALYQSEIDEYNRRYAEIEAMITEEMSEEEIRALFAELGELQVPPFSFEYRDELNFEDFKAKLSIEFLKMFVNYFTDADGRELDFSSINVIADRQLQLGEIVVSLSEEYDTYSEVFEELAERLSVQSKILFEKTPLNERVYANLGGALIPVNNSSTLSNTISRTYYLQANQQAASNSYVTFYYQAESNSWGTASAKIEAITDYSSYAETYSNISVSGGKVTFPSMLLNKFGKVIRSLKIKIFFNNGEEANLEFLGLTMGQPYTGILYTERAKQEIENPSEPGTTPKPGTFIPKHFGVKRLGIADYLKVEQSIHAYVPGEVSNIENVMASELRHKSSVSRDYSEITDTTSESIETEKISDTTKAERNEMQTEVAKEIEKQQSITASTNFSYNTGVYKFDIGGGYANNTAQHDSTRQAVAKSQEITERAMERVLTKINKERVQKIIKEYTETNVHEFDNRGKVTDTNNPDAAQPKHITGVYRWVDKKMKNQIYNYGKRTMFEFMIPEPARLHKLATFVTKENIKEPIDPRKAEGIWKMTDSKSATEQQIKYWADYYGVTLTQLPESNILYTAETGQQNLDNSAAPRTLNLTIPNNYKGYEAYITYAFYNRFKKNSSQLTIDNLKGGFLTFENHNREGWLRSNETITGINVVGNYAMQYAGSNGTTEMSFVVKIKCTLSDAFMAAWKQENFDNIIKAYETAYADFLVKQKEAEEKAKEEKANNEEKLGNFYREMESVILKHNCIAYLLQDYLNTMGQSYTEGDQMSNFQVILGENLEQYAALAKFMEQAFEWQIMDYTFYPYYWGDRKKWQEMYLSQSTDSLFRNFLQAGMARVIVTVKPGFEDAVQFFMTTGRIWNGGEVPVIGDPMYMSIVDEMRQPTGEPQGKFWISRIPTTLTILQAESVGLKVDPDQPLPIFVEEHPENCENPKELETETSFSLDDIRLEGTGDDKTTLG